ncbi:MAG: sulfatase-like hydrolase/transferase [Gammaproteobacteria bacterium]|nr:sulfatase-like hydrolase/transferase [Gammaproteobacteria bacterium]
MDEYKKGTELASKCQGNGCRFDEILLTGLVERITSSNKDKFFVVLHTKGSHDPSYYAKYPSQFEKFTPVCRSEQLSDCTQQALINAYDNTILYTDYFINEAISRLDKLKNIPSMLVYVSDHGESLGESGLYLTAHPIHLRRNIKKRFRFLFGALMQ